MPNKAKGKSSAEYYKENPQSYKKKLEKQKEYNKQPDQVKKRVGLILKNREADKKGVDRSGKDYDHATGRYATSAVNRGRTGKNGIGTAGDKRARGGKN